VCAFCVRHLGAEKAERRDRDHVALWAQLYGEEQEAHRADVAAAEASTNLSNATIATLTARVDQLTQVIASEYTAAPTGDARELLETAVVKRAERNTELAARRIDRTMAVLWRLAELHHDDDARAGHCVCGKPVAKCVESHALDPERQALRDWERKAVALLREGKRHGLPDEHPDVVAASGAGRSSGSAGAGRSSGTAGAGRSSGTAGAPRPAGSAGARNDRGAPDSRRTRG
jgi:uncharacterized membrane protein YgcG